MKPEDLRFKIILTIRQWWDLPEIGRDPIEFEGQTCVEQKLYAEVTVRQFAELLVEYCMDQSVSTQGILEGGRLWPAVCFYDPDENVQCYVSPYTESELAQASELCDEPQTVPVLDNDWSVKQAEMACLPLWGDRWPGIQGAMLSLIDEPIYYGDEDKVEERILNAFGIGSDHGQREIQPTD